jgi:hypothetical protein
MLSQIMERTDDADLIEATGLALAIVASLVERETPIPKGEVGRCLALLAEASGPRTPRQRQILASWAQLLSHQGAAN